MRSDYTIIAFATETPEKYPLYLERLKKNCNDLGLPLKTEILPTPKNTNPKSQAENDFSISKKDAATLYKPTFIRQQIEKTDKPVVYVDCDSIFLDAFSPPEFDFDVGVVRRTSGWAGVSDIVSACIVFNNTFAARMFLNCWCWLCEHENLCPTGDHKRFLATRILMAKRTPYYTEADLTPVFSEKLVFNPGERKESRC